jgi:lipopolysaccharide transport system ATP-binding protein
MKVLAIRTEKLSKHYRIGESLRYLSLREQVASWPRRLLGRGRIDDEAGRVWALDEVTFEVEPGEILGVIGRNGAGKSTLLKILSRITRPSAGRAEIWGRVGSLLEVGTGFHPELTGRENIWLYGAILGLTRQEIRCKFDAILDFAEVERFIDTPVKHYSSGMQMRLAFSVAAHLEPDVLLVDEVLAVGDAEFQKKCLGKMEDSHRGGRAALFVSHNLAAVERVCSRVMILEAGKMRFIGNPGVAVREYLASAGDGSAREWRNPDPSPGRTQLLRAHLCDVNGAPIENPDCSSVFGVAIDFSVETGLRDLVLAMAVCNQHQVPVFSTSPADVGVSVPLEQGLYRTRVLFPGGLLMPKGFSVIISLYNRWRGFDSHSFILPFQVHAVASVATATPTGRLGDVYVDCDWSEVERVREEST